MLTLKKLLDSWTNDDKNLDGDPDETER